MIYIIDCVFNVIICVSVCISPVLYNAEETFCSLNFASRVRTVELGKASKNTVTAGGGGGSSTGLGSASSKVGGGGGVPLNNTVRRTGPGLYIYS
jgi:kinesin family protein C2/C3